MTIHTITAEERNRLTDQAAHLFIARHVRDYFPCEINSRKIMNFIWQNLGEGYPYPLTLDHFENSFSYLSENDFLLQRPVEEPEVDPAVVEENRKQQAVRDDYASRVEADKIARAKNIPLNQLRNEVGVQNKDFRQQRDANLLPVRQP